MTESSEEFNSLTLIEENFSDIQESVSLERVIQQESFHSRNECETIQEAENYAILNDGIADITQEMQEENNLMNGALSTSQTTTNYDRHFSAASVDPNIQLSLLQKSLFSILNESTSSEASNKISTMKEILKNRTMQRTDLNDKELSMTNLLKDDDQTQNTLPIPSDSFDQLLNEVMSSGSLSTRVRELITSLQEKQKNIQSDSTMSRESKQDAYNNLLLIQEDILNTLQSRTLPIIPNNNQTLYNFTYEKTVPFVQNDKPLQHNLMEADSIKQTEDKSNDILFNDLQIGASDISSNTTQSEKSHSISDKTLYLQNKALSVLTAQFQDKPIATMENSAIHSTSPTSSGEQELKLISSSAVQKKLVASLSNAYHQSNDTLEKPTAQAGDASRLTTSSVNQTPTSTSNDLDSEQSQQKVSQTKQAVNLKSLTTSSVNQTPTSTSNDLDSEQSQQKVSQTKQAVNLKSLTTSSVNQTPTSTSNDLDSEQSQQKVSQTKQAVNLKSLTTSSVNQTPTSTSNDLDKEQSQQKVSQTKQAVNLKSLTTSSVNQTPTSISNDLDSEQSQQKVSQTKQAVNLKSLTTSSVNQTPTSTSNDLDKEQSQQKVSQTKQAVNLKSLTTSSVNQTPTSTSNDLKSLTTSSVNQTPTSTSNDLDKEQSQQKVSQTKQAVNLKSLTTSSVNQTPTSTSNDLKSLTTSSVNQTPTSTSNDLDKEQSQQKVSQTKQAVNLKSLTMSSVNQTPTSISNDLDKEQSQQKVSQTKQAVNLKSLTTSSVNQTPTSTSKDLDKKQSQEKVSQTKQDVNLKNTDASKLSEKQQEVLVSLSSALTAGKLNKDLHDALVSLCTDKISPLNQDALLALSGLLSSSHLMQNSSHTTDTSQFSPISPSHNEKTKIEESPILSFTTSFHSLPQTQTAQSSQNKHCLEAPSLSLDEKHIWNQAKTGSWSVSENSQLQKQHIEQPLFLDTKGLPFVYDQNLKDISSRNELQNILINSKKLNTPNEAFTLANYDDFLKNQVAMSKTEEDNVIITTMKELESSSDDKDRSSTSSVSGSELLTPFLLSPFVFSPATSRDTSSSLQISETQSSLDHNHLIAKLTAFDQTPDSISGDGTSVSPIDSHISVDTDNTEDSTFKVDKDNDNFKKWKSDNKQIRSEEKPKEELSTLNDSSITTDKLTLSGISTKSHVTENIHSWSIPSSAAESYSITNSSWSTANQFHSMEPNFKELSVSFSTQTSRPQDLDHESVTTSKWKEEQQFSGYQGTENSGKSYQSSLAQQAYIPSATSQQGKVLMGRSCGSENDRNDDKFLQSVQVVNYNKSATNGQMAISMSSNQRQIVVQSTPSAPEQQKQTQTKPASIPVPPATKLRADATPFVLVSTKTNKITTNGNAPVNNSWQVQTNLRQHEQQMISNQMAQDMIIPCSIEQHQYLGSAGNFQTVNENNNLRPQSFITWDYQVPSDTQTSISFGSNNGSLMEPVAVFTKPEESGYWSNNASRMTSSKQMVYDSGSRVNDDKSMSKDVISSISSTVRLEAMQIANSSHGMTLPSMPVDHLFSAVDMTMMPNFVPHHAPNITNMIIDETALSDSIPPPRPLTPGPYMSQNESLDSQLDATEIPPPRNEHLFSQVKETGGNAVSTALTLGRDFSGEARMLGTLLNLEKDQTALQNESEINRKRLKKFSEELESNRYQSFGDLTWKPQDVYRESFRQSTEQKPVHIGKRNVELSLHSIKEVEWPSTEISRVSAEEFYHQVQNDHEGNAVWSGTIEIPDDFKFITMTEEDYMQHMLDSSQKNKQEYFTSRGFTSNESRMSAEDFFQICRLKGPQTSDVPWHAGDTGFAHAPSLTLTYQLQNDISGNTIDSYNQFIEENNQYLDVYNTQPETSDPYHQIEQTLNEYNQQPYWQREQQLSPKTLSDSRTLHQGQPCLAYIRPGSLSVSHDDLRRLSAEQFFQKDSQRFPELTDGNYFIKAYHQSAEQLFPKSLEETKTGTLETCKLTTEMYQETCQDYQPNTNDSYNQGFYKAGQLFEQISDASSFNTQSQSVNTSNQSVEQFYKLGELRQQIANFSQNTISTDSYDISANQFFKKPEKFSKSSHMFLLSKDQMSIDQSDDISQISIGIVDEKSQIRETGSNDTITSEDRQSADYVITSSSQKSSNVQNDWKSTNEDFLPITGNEFLDLGIKISQNWENVDSKSSDQQIQQFLSATKPCTKRIVENATQTGQALVIPLSSDLLIDDPNKQKLIENRLKKLVEVELATISQVKPESLMLVAESSVVELLNRYRELNSQPSLIEIKSTTSAHPSSSTTQPNSADSNEEAMITVVAAANFQHSAAYRLEKFLEAFNSQPIDNFLSVHNTLEGNKLRSDESSASEIAIVRGTLEGSNVQTTPPEMLTTTFSTDESIQTEESFVKGKRTLELVGEDQRILQQTDEMEQAEENLDDIFEESREIDSENDEKDSGITKITKESVEEIFVAKDLKFLNEDKVTPFVHSETYYRDVAAVVEDIKFEQNDEIILDLHDDLGNPITMDKYLGITMPHDLDVESVLCEEREQLLIESKKENAFRDHVNLRDEDKNEKFSSGDSDDSDYEKSKISTQYSIENYFDDLAAQDTDELQLEDEEDPKSQTAIALYKGRKLDLLSSDEDIFEGSTKPFPPPEEFPPIQSQPEIIIPTPQTSTISIIDDEDDEDESKSKQQLALPRTTPKPDDQWRSNKNEHVTGFCLVEQPALLARERIKAIRRRFDKQQELMEESCLKLKDLIRYEEILVANAQNRLMNQTENKVDDLQEVNANKRKTPVPSPRRRTLPSPTFNWQVSNTHTEEPNEQQLIKELETEKKTPVLYLRLPKTAVAENLATLPLPPVASPRNRLTASPTREESDDDENKQCDKSTSEEQQNPHQTSAVSKNTPISWESLATTRKIPEIPPPRRSSRSPSPMPRRRPRSQSPPEKSTLIPQKSQQETTKMLRLTNYAPVPSPRMITSPAPCNKSLSTTLTNDDLSITPVKKTESTICNEEIGTTNDMSATPPEKKSPTICNEEIVTTNDNLSAVPLEKKSPTVCNEEIVTNNLSATPIEKTSPTICNEKIVEVKETQREESRNDSRDSQLLNDDKTPAVCDDENEENLTMMKYKNPTSHSLSPQVTTQSDSLLKVSKSKNDVVKTEVNASSLDQMAEEEISQLAVPQESAPFLANLESPPTSPIPCKKNRASPSKIQMPTPQLAKISETECQIPENEIMPPPPTQLPISQSPSPELSIPQSPSPQLPIPQSSSSQLPIPQSPSPQLPIPQSPSPQLPIPQSPSPQLQNLQLQNLQLQNSQLQNSQLQNSQLQNSQLQNSQLQNSQLQNPQLHNPQLHNPQLHNPQLQNPQLQNPQLQNPQLQNSQLQNPQLPISQSPCLQSTIAHFPRSHLPVLPISPPLADMYPVTQISMTVPLQQIPLQTTVEKSKPLKLTKEQLLNPKFLLELLTPPSMLHAKAPPKDKNPPVRQWRVPSPLPLSWLLPKSLPRQLQTRPPSPPPPTQIVSHLPPLPPYESHRSPPNTSWSTQNQSDVWQLTLPSLQQQPTIETVINQSSATCPSATWQPISPTPLPEGTVTPAPLAMTSTENRITSDERFVRPLSSWMTRPVSTPPTLNEKQPKPEKKASQSSISEQNPPLKNDKESLQEEKKSTFQEENESTLREESESIFQDKAELVSTDQNDSSASKKSSPTVNEKKKSKPLCSLPPSGRSSAPVEEEAISSSRDSLSNTQIDVSRNSNLVIEICPTCRQVTEQHSSTRIPLSGRRSTSRQQLSVRRSTSRQHLTAIRTTSRHSHEHTSTSNQQYNDQQQQATNQTPLSPHRPRQVLSEQRTSYSPNVDDQSSISYRISAQPPSPRQRSVSPHPLSPRSLSPRSLSPRPLSPRSSPRSVSPRSVSPRSVSPRSVSPRSISPRSISPRSVSPRSVSPRSVSPRSVSPRSVSPRSVSPRPVSPRPVSPRPVSPRPVSPRPVSPRPVSPCLVSPRSVSSRPVSPRPVSPRPVSPRPVSPRPVSPRPVSTISNYRLGSTSPQPMPITSYRMSPPIAGTSGSSPINQLDFRGVNKLYTLVIDDSADESEESEDDGRARAMNVEEGYYDNGIFLSDPGLSEEEDADAIAIALQEESYDPQTGQALFYHHHPKQSVNCMAPVYHPPFHIQMHTFGSMSGFSDRIAFTRTISPPYYEPEVNARAFPVQQSSNRCYGHEVRRLPGLDGMNSDSDDDVDGQVDMETIRVPIPPPRVLGVNPFYGLYPFARF